ncbi:hypothetical protein E0H26_13505 [Micromonospora zingiberis]|uniref:Uncharacterized protein n=1 Tax=Micromonospora zingiberis TaxID=2053011 RepID=A0A4R0GJ89_9ACTN|nr:hypothetical protein [Micromonospora zingiberis]TCB97276.1 hypothetical protein E0H26_13505 [Micromonospora zingiberis]
MADVGYDRYADPDYVSGSAYNQLSGRERRHFDNLSEERQEWIGSHSELIEAVREYDAAKESVEFLNSIKDGAYDDLYSGPYREHLPGGQEYVNPGHIVGTPNWSVDRPVTYHHVTRAGERNMTDAEREQLRQANGLGFVAYDREIDNANWRIGNSAEIVRRETARLIGVIRRADSAAGTSVVRNDAQGQGSNTNRRSDGSSSSRSHGSGRSNRRR